LLDELTTYPAADVCWIAYSGGMDSSVLLHSLAALRGRLPFEIRALHVDHGMRASSSVWAEHCFRTCERLGILLESRKVEVATARGESLEAVARERRYRVMAELVGQGDLLLTAQHRDDQAETLLLALMRGSGTKGLAGMPRRAPFGAGWLVRPLLEFSRAQLLDYARSHGIAWIEDPANGDLSFDRNFLRHRVLPLLAQRWPACATTVARSAAHCAEAQGLIELFARDELDAIAGQRPYTLSVSCLEQLSLSLRKAVLRQWFHDRRLAPPDSRHLERIFTEVMRARADANPLVVWPGCEVRRYRDDLFAMKPLPPVPDREPIQWCTGALSLPDGLGRLELLGLDGRGLDPRDLIADGLLVRFGVAGLGCRQGPGGPNRRLRKLFQEVGVPPWMRSLIPLLFAEGALFAVGDIWMCSHAGDLAQRRFMIRWTNDLPAWRRPLVDSTQATATVTGGHA
jgi:tRNA(Ile)-lysidine synthase